MNPLISVIVPVYNGQDYIEKCIESIWNQTYDNLEVIVVDDGSTDNTGKICDELMVRYSSVNSKGRSLRVITIGEEGVSVARNIGIETATGELISFVDADDRLANDIIEILYDGMKKTDADVSGCSFFMWSDEEELEQRLQDDRSTSAGPRVYSAAEFQEQILCGNTRCWSKLYKKEIFKDGNNRFEKELTIGEDMLFLAGLSSGGYTFCETDYQGYGYYRNINGAMIKKFTPEVMDQIYCWEKAREILGASVRLDSNIIISALLTIGRIARLERDEQKTFSKEMDIITSSIKKYYSREVYSLLDRGYKIKTKLYSFSPKLYLWLYSNWKKA